ncbi:MAG: hypothetical protein ACXWZ1_11150, partial [Gaiellaceae bacterium]
MRPRFLALLAATAIVVVTAGVFMLARAEDAADSSATAVSEHPVVVPAAARTVSVSRVMPMPSAHERRLSAMLEDGRMPDRPML